MYHDDLTVEELQFYINTRINKIKVKALKRLSMTQEENELFKFIHELKNNPELRELFTILLITNLI